MKLKNTRSSRKTLGVAPLILHTIQSSSSGRNSIITPEVATNPLLLQNCN